jgi:hypothetical protein
VALLRVLASETEVAKAPSISLMDVVDSAGNPSIFLVPGVTVRREQLELPAGFGTSNARTEIILTKDGPRLFQ